MASIIYLSNYNCSIKQQAHALAILDLQDASVMLTALYHCAIINTSQLCKTAGQSVTIWGGRMSVVAGPDNCFPFLSKQDP